MDFNNTNWPIMRGAIHGMMDGIRSVQPNASCAVNFCLTDIAAADMLWEGTQPDGSSGHTQIRWNFTTWHSYGPYGDDIFNSGFDDDGPGFDIPIYAMARYGVPFWITEWNALVDPQFNETDRAIYIQETFATYYNARKSKYIETTMLYELTQDGEPQWWGLVEHNLTKVQPTYDTFKNFIQQHPDN